MFKYVLFQIAFVFFMLSCKNKEHNKVVTINTKNQSLPLLDIAGELSTSASDTFTWNTIAKKIRLVPLSSSEPLGQNPIIYEIIDSLIFVQDTQTQSVRVYGLDGSDMAAFRKVGQGPGEYIHFTYMKFNQGDSSILVFDNNGKVLTYLLNGRCVEEKNIKNREWGNIVYIDTLDVAYTRNGPGSESLVSVLNQDLTIKDNYFIYDSMNTDKYKAGFYLMCNKSNTRDNYLINTPLNDTLFSINNTGLVPICILDRGGNSLSGRDLYDGIMGLPPVNDLITYTGIDKFSNYILYRFYWEGQFYIQLWNIHEEKLIGKVKLNQPSQFSGLLGGFDYVFNSGKRLKLTPNYVTDTRLGFIISAEDCVGEINGVKEDDNPVLLIIDLN